MDIGITNIVTVIADSAGEYLVTYAPLFVLIAGLVLALGIIGAILDRLFPDNTAKNSDPE